MPPSSADTRGAGGADRRAAGAPRRRGRRRPRAVGCGLFVLAVAGTALAIWLDGRADAPPLPLDPYTGKPYGYDPARGWIWSAGADGINEGGADLTVVIPR